MGGTEVALRHLAAIRAYQAAIKVASPGLRAGLAALMANHEERARELAKALQRPPDPSKVSVRLAEEIGSLEDEAGRLRGLARMEEEMLVACEEDFVELSRRHLAWLREHST